MQTMYAAMVNSPSTTIDEAFTAGDNHIHVTTTSVFPAAPNEVTIGTGEDAVTYKYTSITAGASGSLDGVTVVEGSAKSWDSGTTIYRAFTAYDHNAFKANLTESPSDMARQAVTNSNFDIWQRLGTVIATTKRARSSNVATLTTAAVHNLAAGDQVCIYSVGGDDYNTPSAVVVSTPSTTTFTYANTGDDESEAADTAGRVYGFSRPVHIDPADAAFTADRWFIDSAADSGTFPTLLHVRGTVTPEALPGSYYDYKVTTSGAGTDLGANSYYQICQKIVGGTARLAGASKTVTVSFQAKSSIGSKKIGCYLEQNYGTSGSAAETIVGDAWTLTSSWQKCTCTFTTNTLSGKTVSADNALILHLALQWGSNYDDEVGETGAETFVGAGDIEIAQVQVCSGNVALDYRPPNPAQELAICMLDYDRLGMKGTITQFCIAENSETTEANGIVLYATKRIVPSITTSAGTFFQVKGADDQQGVACEADDIALTSFRFTVVVTSGLTVAAASRLSNKVDGSYGAGYIEIYTGY